MKKNRTGCRLLSLLLTLAMILTLAPAALAAETCPSCSSSNCQWTTIKEANCHEEGVRECVCANCGRTTLVKTAIDRGNHDAYYTDNGDGLTHTAVCPYDNNIDRAETHEYVNGVCVKCGAVDYDGAQLTLPQNAVIYAKLGDTEAAISLAEVSLQVGSGNVTDNYTWTYHWYDGRGQSVGTGESYPLPASVTAKEGDYTYVCFVLASPKTGVSSRPIDGSCTVTVRVRDLVTAYAEADGDMDYLELGGYGQGSDLSVVDQLYNSTYDLSTGEPLCVVFDEKPTSKVGTLSLVSGRSYYFNPSAGQADISSVRFVPDAENSGDYVINFTAYDNKGKQFPGVLTITVQQTLGDLDILYTTTKGAAVALAGEDFNDFWLDCFPSGLFTGVRFTTLPATTAGALYDGYVSALRPGTRLKSSDTCYYEPTDRQMGIDLTFVPAAAFTGHVTIPFVAYGENNRGVSKQENGEMHILVTAGKVAEVSVQVTGSAAALSPAAFLSVYQAATGTTAKDFSIQLTQLPAYGGLYVDYTEGRTNRPLTALSAAGYLFRYNGQGAQIADLTYVPGTAMQDSASYIAYDTKGVAQFEGTICFVKGELTVSYTTSAAGVAFAASDFEKVLGISSPLAYVSFSQPTSGALYYNKTGLGAGTAVTAADRYYLSTGMPNLSNISYVPRGGQNGIISIPFTAADANGVTFSGTVRITVRTSYTKSFTDVKTTDWFYTQVMDLAEAGIISGMTTTTYEPSSEVTYAQALKLIMMATGYSNLTPTGKHWASGFLAAAQRDGLIATSVTETYLDRKISRNVIAQIAAKAMKLPASALTVSPFSDVTVGTTYAPYIFALYEAGIVIGDNTNGAVKFYGVNSIRRSEMATIVWRINNYKG